MNKILKIGMIAVLFAVFFASCVPQKKMLYLKDAEMATKNLSREYVNDRSVDYKLQPGDNLYIHVINTIDERSAASINGDVRGYLSSDANIYLQTTTIDEDGCVEMPLVGKVQVKNLTVDEAKDRLQNSINTYINGSMLVVKLASFNLTLLGEVSRPGMYKVYQSQINLFEAVSLAGNMTNFAKKSEVRIVRQTDNGSEIITVDMGKADILSSPYYYLKPNDIVYVEPLKIKQWGFTSFPYSTIFSLASLAATLYLAFRK
jgi:polysaccharide export outer membrane protein